METHKSIGHIIHKKIQSPLDRNIYNCTDPYVFNDIESIFINKSLKFIITIHTRINNSQHTWK